jgi:tRNA pseudouridine13 synthase
MESLPFLTRDYPGIGGRLKTELDDFIVEEIPLYQPCGDGRHCYAFVEKRGLSTYQLVSALARALDVLPEAVGYAGLKDGRAVTRQLISIDGVEPARVQTLGLAGIRVLWVSRHRNKLKLGHLAGNRFSIRVRGIDQDAREAAAAVLAELGRRGVPNYYGEQRFGQRQNTHLLGRALLQGDGSGFVREYLGRPQPGERADLRAARAAVEAGDYAGALAGWPPGLREERWLLAALVKRQGDTSQVVSTLDKKLRRLFATAYQSHLFNRLLAQRIDTLDRLELGDVAFIHASGAAFVVQDPAVEQPRADRFEISPSGPLFGPKVLLGEGQPGQRERAALAESGLSLADFRLPGVRLDGARRPFRVPLTEVEVGWDDGLVLQFCLPPGSYATEVLREVMKHD